MRGRKEAIKIADPNEDLHPAGESSKQEHDATQATLKEAAKLLKDERVRQGLSLSDIQQRTGIDPPNLSRLENDAGANPTVATLTRYAEAPGKKLMIVLSDQTTH